MTGRMALNVEHGCKGAAVQKARHNSEQAASDGKNEREMCVTYCAGESNQSLKPCVLRGMFTTFYEVTFFATSCPCMYYTAMWGGGMSNI